jgi:succinyl-diaminopimelate desuccinylase
MKGAVAASVAATLQYLAKHGKPKGSIVFLLTGDEEGPAVNGTVKLLEWAKARGERFDHCLLGEPTNPDALGDMIKIGRRGSLSATLTMHGKQGHVGYPRLADNPVYALARLVAALRSTPLDAGTPHFDASNLEVTVMETDSKAVNVIPGEARMLFNIRFNDLWTPDTLSAEIRARVEAAAEGARYTLTFQPTNALAFLTTPGRFVELVSGAVEAETGRRPALSTTGGTSDARFIRDHAEVLEFGLVGQTMHAIDERVAIDDLEKLTAIYARVLERYFGATG